MAPIFAIVGAATLAAAFLGFAWTMQRQSHRGRACDDADDAAGSWYVS